MTNEFLNNVYQGDNSWKSYVATIIFGYLIFIVLKLLLIYYEPVLEPLEVFSLPLYEVLTTVHIIGLILLLFSIKIFLKRSPISVINVSKKYDPKGNKLSWYNRIRWRKFLKGFGIWTILLIICSIVSLFIAGEFFSISNFVNSDIFDLNGFIDIISILVLILLAIPLQTAYEEVFCRGFLNQALSLKIKNPIFIILLSSLFFSLGHFLSPNYQAQIFSFLFALVLGIFFSLLTLMDNGIETAWGVHAANNILMQLINPGIGLIFLIILLLPVFAVFKRKNIKESFK